jgi:hypothetical protein
VNAWGRSIFLFAGQRAGIAADAALEINHHPESSHRSTSKDDIC